MQNIYEINPVKTKKIIKKAIDISYTHDEVRYFFKNYFCLSVLPDGYILDINNKTISISKDLDNFIGYDSNFEDFNNFCSLVRKEYASRKLA